jgi:hypothetical protein
VSDVYELGKSKFIELTKTKDRVLLYSLFVALFVCMEIMWRMMFEFIIAYLQIREALIELSAG